MKSKVKFIAVIFIFFFSKVCYSQLTNKWEIADSAEIEYPYFQETIDYVDENDIVVFGDLSYSEKNWYQIAQFTNLAENKKILYADTIHATDEWNSISHPSANVIIVVGDSLEYIGDFNGREYKRYGLIIKTTDGGKTWKRTVIDSNLYIAGISMCDSVNGVILQSSYGNYFNKGVKKQYSLLVTKDCWNSYKTIALPEENKDKSGVEVYCVSPGKFYFLYKKDEAENHTLAITKDSGKNWETAFNYGSNFNITDLNFVNSNLIYAIGKTKSRYKNELVFFLSKDGGYSWHRMIENEKKYYENPRDFDFSDSLNGLRANGSQLFYRTTSGGKTWSEEYAPFKIKKALYGSISKIIFPSCDFALAVSQRHFLMKCLHNKILALPKFYYHVNERYQNPKNFILRWSNIKGAKEYRLKLDGYSKSVNGACDFQNPDIDTTITDTSVVFNNLNNNFYYQARVKAIGDTIESDWAESYLLGTMDKDELIPPGLIFPSYDQVINSSNIKLIWQNIPKAKSYYVSVKETYHEYVRTFENIKDTFAFITDLIPDKRYKVSLRSIADDSVSKFSPPCYFYTSPVLSVKEIKRYQKSNLLVYPNPVRNSVYIKFESKICGNAHLSIHDLLGANIFQSEIHVLKGENSKPIQVKDYANGVYFVKIIIGEIIKKGIFIKK